MELLEAMVRRHSVRQYKDIPLSPELIDALQREMNAINREAQLHFQLVTDEPKAFDSFLAHYGRFEGVRNYFALVGKRCENFEEKIGYYGQRLVLKAQQLGLHTCWVALTYKKLPEMFTVGKEEKFSLVIAVGHGRNKGLVRKSKTAEQVSNLSALTPAWFASGVKAALLAPTAMNQQKFFFTYDNGKVKAKAGIGPYAKMDLGIAKYQFELGAGRAVEWE